MNITVSYIEQKFEEFNQQMFAGKLPMLPICLSDAKTFWVFAHIKEEKQRMVRLKGMVSPYVSIPVLTCRSKRWKTQSFTR